MSMKSTGKVALRISSDLKLLSVSSIWVLKPSTSNGS